MIEILLATLLLICISIKNYTVAIAVVIVLFVKLLNLTKAMATFDVYCIPVGIILLTVGVLIPLVNGRVNVLELSNIYKNHVFILSVVIGVGVSYLGGKGIPFMKEQPLMIPGLTIGTLLGVVFFKGIPVGPLIAAGMTAMLARGLGLLRLFILIPLFFQATIALAHSEECEQDWPQSCGVLKPDPVGAFSFDMATGPPEEKIDVALYTLVDPNEIPQILCQSSTLGSGQAVADFVRTRLKRYLAPKSLKTHNLHAAIVPTVLKVRYKSGRVLSFGESDEYFCVNDLADRIYYGYPSREVNR